MYLYKTQLLFLLFGNELLFVYDADDTNQLEAWHMLSTVSRREAGLLQSFTVYGPAPFGSRAHICANKV